MKLFLQNVESPLNNLREKKQKKLYFSYCIEKKNYHNACRNMVDISLCQ